MKPIFIPDRKPTKGERIKSFLIDLAATIFVAVFIVSILAAWLWGIS